MAGTRTVTGRGSTQQRVPTRRTAPASIPVLMYHDISDDAGWRYAVPPSLFAEHLDALAGAGYTTAQFRDVPLTPSTVAPATAFLTFDDGYVSYAETVAPLLASHGMTGTVFVPTAFIGSRAGWLRSCGQEHRRIMDWQHLRDVVAAGSEVGGHGHRHLQFDLLGRSALRDEIITGRRILSAELGPVDSLAYPFGYHSGPARAVAEEAGYRVACEVGLGLHAVTPGHRYSVRRILVGPETTPEDLLAAMTRPPSPLVDQARRLARPAWRIKRRVLDRT